MTDDRPAARALRGLLRHAPGLAVVLAVALAPFVTCVLRGETPFFLDLSDHWYPFRVHAWEARQQGEIAHWCGRAFCGFPFLGQAEAGLLYPVHWLTDLVHPSRTLLPQVIGHRFVLGALLYAVIAARGGSRTAAALGGALAVASGVTMSCFTQIAVLRTLVWLPLLLLGAARLAQGRRREGLVWTALGTGLALVAGYPPFLQRAAVALPFLLVLDPVAPRRAADWTERGVRLLYAGFGAAIGAAMAAAQLLPTLELTAVSQRQLGLDPALLDAMRVEPLDALMLVLPRSASQAGIGRQGFAYLGVLPLALGALAVVRRRPGAVAFAAAAAAALVASMGRAVPLAGDLLASLPMAGSFRNPAQYLVAWILVVPVLAAMGLDAWRERAPSRREAVGCLGGVAAVLLVAALVPDLATDASVLVRAAIGAAGLAAGAVALAVPARFAPCLLVTACLVDAGSFLFRYPTREGRTRSVASLRVADTPFERVAARHRETNRPGRPRAITSDAEFNWENHGWIAGVDDVRGLVSLVPMRALDLSRIVQEGAPFPRVPPAEPLYAYGPTHATASPRLDLLAVEYAIGWSFRPGPDWQPIGGDCWERDAAAELRFAKDGRLVASTGSDDEWGPLADPAFRARSDAILSIPPPLPAPGGLRHFDAEGTGAVRVTARTTNTLRLEAETAAGCALVWSQTFDEGWTCRVDGAEAPVLRANWAHMAVHVPPGRHEVVWEYESPGWRAGLRISLAGVAAFVLCAVAAWRRRRLPG